MKYTMHVNSLVWVLTFNYPLNQSFWFISKWYLYKVKVLHLNSFFLKQIFSFAKTICETGYFSIVFFFLPLLPRTMRAWFFQLISGSSIPLAYLSVCMSVQGGLHHFSSVEYYLWPGIVSSPDVSDSLELS